MDDTHTELARVNAEINQCRAALRSPRIGLFESRRLYRRLEQLYRQIDALEIDGAINHIEAMDHEKELSSHSTVYRNG